MWLSTLCNYTWNVFNDLTISELPYNVVTLSPELNKIDLQNFTNTSNSELIVYGRTPLMNSNYCLLGKTNKCYKSCNHLCIGSSNKKSKLLYRPSLAAFSDITITDKCPI